MIKEQQLRFEKIFEFKEYSAILTDDGIRYRIDGNDWQVASVFRNKYDEESGEIIIENVFMRLNCICAFDRKGMFDFIARGFNINIQEKKENELKFTKADSKVIFFGGYNRGCHIASALLESPIDEFPGYKKFMADEFPDKK